MQSTLLVRIMIPRLITDLTKLRGMSQRPVVLGG